MVKLENAGIKKLRKSGLMPTDIVDKLLFNNLVISYAVVLYDAQNV